MVDFTFDEYEVSLLVFFDNFGLELNLFDINMATPACFFGPFAWKFFFPIFYFEVVSDFDSEVCFRYAAKCWVLFTYPVCILCVFIGELNPLILRDMTEM